MKVFKLFSVILYIVVVLITASLGIKFISATEYFGYHAEAAGTSWAAIEPGLQVVYLAVFKVCGAAILSVCVCMLIMIIVPFAKHHHRWSYYAIPIVGMLFWSITLATTLYVTSVTSAKAPWIGSLICVVMILVAFVSSLLHRSALPNKANSADAKSPAAV